MEKNNIYQFKLDGKVSLNWKDWFPGITITFKENSTYLKGNVRDHSKLYGIFIIFRDLGLKLEAFNQIKEENYE